MMGLGEGGRKRAAAMWYLVGLPSYKNLTEAAQLLLARCHAELVAASKKEETSQYEQNHPVISIDEWRPIEPAQVEKARLARRAGRNTRYEQVGELAEQGMTAKAIARRLDLSD